jgi:hypothetical protein
VTPTFKVGDAVRFRDDATTDGEPIGELFRNRTWVLVSIDGALVEIVSNYQSTELKLLTLAYKLRPALPEEKGS